MRHRHSPTTALSAALFAATGLFLSPGPASAQNVLRSDWAEVMAEVRPVVEAEMDAAGVTGLSLVLVDGDELVWSEGFGHADLAAGVKADADTVFEIGSVSKTFTGLMVMRLAEEGKLDIDRPVTDYIPSFRLAPPVRDFPRSDRPVTVRDMMTHHSGMPGDLLNGVFGTAYDPGYGGKLLDWLARDSATYPPGYRLSYSNTAVALLENVIEAASGKPFKEYSDAFLASIGMGPSSFFKDDPALLAKLSRPYMEGVEIPMTYINVPASGSIAASANQMARYLRMLLGSGTIEGRRIVRPETLDAMLEPQNAGVALDLGIDMGLSFFLSDPEFAWAGRLFWHNGATYAFRSHMEILRDQGLAVFAVSNSGEGGPAAERVAKAALAAALKSKRGLSRPEPEKAQPLSRIALPSRLLDTLAGVYVNDDQGFYLRLRAQGGGLARTMVSVAGSAEADPLYLWSDGLFRAKADSPGAGEFREIAGRFLLVSASGAGRNRAAESIIAERFVPKEVSAAWKARLGNWTSRNQDPLDIGTRLGTMPTLTLAISDGMLTMDNNGTLLVLEPISDTVAAVRGLGRAGASSVRVVVENGEERLRYLMNAYGRRPER